MPIQEVTIRTQQAYAPRRSTPLLDSLGRGSNNLESTLKSKGDGEKPSPEDPEKKQKL